MLKNLYGEKRTARSQQELNVILEAHERFANGRGGARAKLNSADLSGLNLVKRKLTEADFGGAALVGATMIGSDFERASFYCTDLQRADLRYANMKFADLRGASLKGANLSFAKLDNADLRAAMMMYVSAEGVSVLDRNKNSGPQGVDFSNCSLKRVSFGNAKLDNANFRGAILQNANFKGARLGNASFVGAVLTGVNLKDLSVPASALEGCVTDVAPEAVARFDELRQRLDLHQQWIASGGKQGHHCVLDGEDMRPLENLVVGRHLTGLSARSTVAVGLNFSGCQLQGAQFRRRRSARRRFHRRGSARRNLAQRQAHACQFRPGRHARIAPQQRAYPRDQSDRRDWCRGAIRNRTTRRQIHRIGPEQPDRNRRSRLAPVPAFAYDPS